MSAVVERSIIVSCDQEHAFGVWTERLGIWWPRAHSMTQDPEATFVLEHGVGGRLLERTAGEEFEWARVAEWTSPQRLVLDWYAGASPEEPSRVTISFIATGEGETRIDVQHERGAQPEELWDERRGSYEKPWENVLEATRRDVLTELHEG